MVDPVAGARYTESPPFDSSGLSHNELRSVAITSGGLAPARYPSRCDIQLWHLTDLAVAFELSEKY